MQWFFIALVAPFLWALVNLADKYLVTRFSHKEEERSSGGLVLFSIKCVRISRLLKKQYD